jgi:hypothetical protein
MNFICVSSCSRRLVGGWQLSRDGVIQNHGAAFFADQDRRRLADGF